MCRVLASCCWFGVSEQELARVLRSSPRGSGMHVLSPIITPQQRSHQRGNLKLAKLLTLAEETWSHREGEGVAMRSETALQRDVGLL